MGISYEIEEPLTEVEIVLLQSLLHRKSYLVRALPDESSSPAELLEEANRLCREAFERINAEAVRADATGAGGRTAALGRPVTLEELRTLEEAVAGAVRVGSVVQATQAIAMARYGAIDREVVDTDTGFGAPVEYALGHQADFADTDLAAACEMAPRTASSRMGAAVTACAKTPRLVRLAVEGGAPFWKVNLVASEMVDASVQTAARVEEHLLGCRGFDGWGYQKLRNTVRALVLQWEVEAAKQTRQRTVRDATGVWAEPGDVPGMSQLRAVGPSDQIARVMGAVDQLADQWRKHPEQHAAAHPDRPGLDGLARESSDVSPGAAFKPTLGQLRLDALHDLATRGAEVSYQVVVHVPVHRDGRTGPDGERGADASGRSTAQSAERRARRAEFGGGCWDPGDPLPGPSRPDERAEPVGSSNDEDEAGLASRRPFESREPGPNGVRIGWADVPGVGIIDAETLAALNDRFGCRLTRVLVDAHTGVTAQTASARYEPPPRIREFVQLRDGSCRFPNCSRPARRCDEDHVQEWPAGETRGTNLAALCRHHHDAKTKGHWDVEMTDDGVCTWISRTGRTYITYPDSAD